MTSVANNPASAPALSKPRPRITVHRPRTLRQTSIVRAGYHASTSPALAATGCKIGLFTTASAAGMPRTCTEPMTDGNPDSAGVIRHDIPQCALNVTMCTDAR
jgi:hypothetical protein